jgi:S-adenosylmethionine-diacylglycerol 3-amino-3-carboxypropyl transferase
MDQVELSQLLFGMSWEDPASDVRALTIRPSDIVVTISSGGCNTLTLLLEDPARIFAIDINGSQSHLLELKRAAIRRLEYQELWAFLGLTPSDARMQTFQNLQNDLSPAARQYWTTNPEAVRLGVAYQGRYESFIQKFGRVLSIVQGKKRIEGFFQCETLEQQRQYFDKKWNTPQWRLLFQLAFNKRMLAKRGLTADYFKFDDGSSSFAESFFRRSKHAMCEIPIGENYFLAQYLRGRYWSEGAVPAYLRKENLPIVRDRLDRIEVVTSDAKSWLGRQADSSIDAFSLSNICELMSLDETARLFTEVARSARPGARVCFRNLIVSRGVPASLQNVIELREQTSRELISQDRSFVYSRVQAYVVKGNVPDRGESPTW